VTEDGEWLELDSLNDLVETAPSSFYIAAIDDNDHPESTEKGDPEDYGYGKTIYAITR
jgi:hypothetical protein